jgi:adenylosuccinate lyase
MAATEKMKQGEPCDLLARLAAEKDFGLTEEEMRAVLDPAKYVGRCGAQVTALANRVRPLFADATETKDSIDV